MGKGLIMAKKNTTTTSTKATTSSKNGGKKMSNKATNKATTKVENKEINEKVSVEMTHENKVNDVKVAIDYGKKSLKKDELIAIAKNVGFEYETVRLIYTNMRKEESARKVALKIDNFIKSNLILKYKDTSFTIKALYLSDLDVVVFKALDKNSYVFAYDNKGSLSFKSESIYSETSKKYEFGKALTKANNSKVCDLLTNRFSGCNYRELLDILLGLNTKCCELGKKSLVLTSRESNNKEKEIVKRLSK